MGAQLLNCRVAALLVLLGLLCRAQTAQVPLFSLSIAARSASARTGSPIWVDVKIENNSRHPIAVYRAITEDMDQGGWVDKVDIRDENGQEPPQTEYAKRIEVGSDGGYIPLAPSKVFRESINVSKLYDLGRAGTYVIRIQRFDEETKTFVKSNEVRVVVTH